MEGVGRGNDSGRGRGRGRGGNGGRRGNNEDQQGGGRGRGGSQNQGGGRGWDGPNRGPFPQQPPARPQWVVNRPPQQAAAAAAAPQSVGVGPAGGRGSTWTGRPWGPSSSTPPVQTPPAWGPSSSTRPAQPPTSPAKPAIAAVQQGVQALAISEKQPSPSQTKEGQIQAIRRPDRGGALSVRRINLVVNHFPVNFDREGTIYHYDVDVQPVATNGDRPAKKVLRKSDMRFIKDLAFPGAELLNTVYDGEKNVFSAIRLGEGKYRVDVPEGEDVRSGAYMFTIKLVNELKLSRLNDYLRGSLSSVPRDTLQGLDLVMKENPMRTRIALGSRSFFSSQNSADLRFGLEACKGFIPSLKPTGQGLALCVDYSVLAFRKPLPVFEFLRQHVGMGEVNDVVRMRKNINDVLRGLKVKVTHRRTNQKYTIAGLTKENTRDIYFDLVDREGDAPPQNTSLVDYFREKWGKKIRYLDIPCLDVGKPKKPNVIPMEFCVLAEGQRFPKENLDKDTAVYLKKLTLVKPWERKNTICDMVQAEDGPFGEIANNFGISLDTNMTRVEGRVIGAPELKVGGPRPVRVDAEKCQWNLVGKSFVDAKSLDCWALLDFTDGDRYARLQKEAFVNNLRGRCRNLGIQMAEPVVYRLTQMRELSSKNRLEKLLKDVVSESSRMNKGKLQMIAIAMTRKDPGYKYIKWISETQIGVVTQCFLSPSANKGQDQYLANLCLKINVKLGGTNFEVSGKLLNFNGGDHVMFIGADVNHPAPMNKECPSIAAVVGTVNWPAANRYAARVSPQTHRCETIKNFGAMCLDLVNAYGRINKVRPRKILVFRDGVSEGQFEMVLRQELFDLKNAIYTDDYQPPITVIVAQKRHQTRLFVENKNDGGQTGNVPPGTVVDTTIVHPHDFDFYLCSHYGGIGTSKPTHYCVLLDENGFTSDQLQKLIYDMCFTFVRCTKPVSLVPPVYYADLVAYRGRMFQEVAMEDPCASSAASFDQSFYSLHPDLVNNMFFV